MKDAKGHGSDRRGNSMPIPGHDYHTKSDAELRYIAKDASAAEQATRGMSSYNPNSGKREDTAGKYSDQLNNAASVLAYRARGGAQVVKDIAAQHDIPTAHLEPHTVSGGQMDAYLRFARGFTGSGAVKEPRKRNVGSES